MENEGPLPARPSTAPAAHKAAASGWKPCYVADCASKPLPGPGPLGDMRRVVDDPLASVKVVREVFSSRALHMAPSQAGLQQQRQSLQRYLAHACS
ncbi:hypothetical protein HaLaN_12168 [Haematococcus lacustris]|uniref:Uncharacterized protein n=1 Tax=Haematococcus lacustris TaxID=44745 RepID=A0A699Z9D8_HAELA|nr:hypothetical protein HaLaN_12168 [Haematococcus lacustris]